MTDTFILFTAARKQQIDHLRNRLMTERPYTHVHWGNSVSRIHPLGLTDYVVYAALRGADYRKGDHTGGKKATEALEGVIRAIAYWGSSKAKTGSALHDKYLPEGQTDEDFFALKDALEAELVKWKDAPTVR